MTFVQRLIKLTVVLAIPAGLMTLMFSTTEKPSIAKYEEVDERSRNKNVLIMQKLRAAAESDQPIYRPKKTAD